MPEGLEAEIWRRAATSLVGRSIERAWHDERCATDDVAAIVTGGTITGVRRRGKVLVIEVDRTDLGVHFGMTGRAVFDGTAPIERLEYASGADRAEWDRLQLFTDDSDIAALRVNDPRRLGRISIDEDLTHLGPDLFVVSVEQLAASFSRRRKAVKSVLLDQRIVAGLGNLCADEMLFWADVAPHRPADSLTPAELGAVVDACAVQLPVMLAAGGSTMGALDPSTRSGLPSCPRCGGELARTTLAGRTAVWCRAHQR